MTGHQSSVLAHVSDGDQRDHGESAKDNPAPLEGGEQSAHHINDPNDSYSLADRAKAEKKKEKEEEEAEEARKAIKPTDIARSHGNEPSRGAIIDEQIENEEAEIIAKMDAKKANK